MSRLVKKKSSIHLDQTPADPMQRTREYVAEQSAQLNSQPAAPQLVQSSALQHTRSPASQFDQPTNSEASFRYFPDPSEDHRRRCSTENRHDHSSDLMRYFARRELLQASMLKFSDRPKDYRAWRRSFRNSIVDLRLTPSEEMDLLVKWLGPASTEHANRLRTAYLNHPEKGLQEIWKRLEKCYGSPEAIEDSLFERIHRFPKVTKDYDRLRELSDLLTELQAAKDDGDLPGLALLDTARGLRPIVEKLPPTLRDQWTSHGTTYKRKHQVPFPPFSVFTKFIEQQAEDRNDPSFRLTTDTWPSQNMDRTTTPQRKEISVHKTQIASKDIKEICPIHNLPHPLRSCRAFRSKPFPERQAYLRQHNICFRCCATHVNKDCRFKPKCAECGSESHNTALHPEPVPQTTPIRAMPNHGGENNDITAHCTQVCGNNLIEKSCSKICLVKVHPQGQRNKAVRMYAVIDEHSNKSLARPEFFELFSDHGPTSSYSLRTCAGVIETWGTYASGDDKPSTVDTFFTSTREGSRPTNFEPCPNTFRAKERYCRKGLGSSVFQPTKEDDRLAYSIEDRIFLDIMEKGVKRNSHRSWVAPLPFKPYRLRLPNNRQQAVSRLNSLTRQFRKKPYFFTGLLLLLPFSSFLLPFPARCMPFNLSNSSFWFGTCLHAPLLAAPPFLITLVCFIPFSFCFFFIRLSTFATTVCLAAAGSKLAYFFLSFFVLSCFLLCLSSPLPLGPFRRSGLMFFVHFFFQIFYLIHRIKSFVFQ
ncbi:unnamed protein product [Acanthosepion pharaonis]|uniref:Uncharacterized protein n=1 Tax=Acanthosepion pharaonis TaxID=158019 RepID=A0A812EG98_ACAPH|nr:unnamed protein product [Sepia pharaonis]